MISDELKEIIDQIKDQGKMHFLEAATEEQIAQFEEKNEVKLPSKYKEWLLCSDGGEFFLPAGIQMYGVAHKPVIDLTDSDKPDESFTIIGVTSWGDPILCEKASEKISIYDHEAGKIQEDEIYEDYFAFLKDLYNLLGIGD